MVSPGHGCGLWGPVYQRRAGFTSLFGKDPEWVEEFQGCVDGFEYSHISPDKVYFVLASYFLALGEMMVWSVHFFSDSFVGREINFSGNPCLY